LADARGARLAIVVGPDDRARGEVQLKDLVGKTQEAVAREALPARCRDLLFRMP
jgi:histidyl-tRNA synthetase